MGQTITILLKIGPPETLFPVSHTLTGFRPNCLLSQTIHVQAFVKTNALAGMTDGNTSRRGDPRGRPKKVCDRSNPARVALFVAGLLRGGLALKSLFCGPVFPS